MRSTKLLKISGLRFVVLVFVLYFLAALICYAPTINGGFQVDDWWWCENARAYGLLGNDHNHVAGVGMFYRPTVSVAFGLIWDVFGAQPAPYRIFSLLLLAATGTALFGLWRRLMPSSSRLVALLVGALFVLWPTHVEATAWIAAMTDGLAVCCASWALFTYVVSVAEDKSRGLWLSGALLLVAMLSKESAVVLPVICLFIGRLANRRVRVAPIISLLAPALIYIFLRWNAIGQMVGGYAGRESPMAVLSSLASNDAAVNLANDYLPLGKWIALWFGFPAVKLVLKMVGLSIAAALIWGLPRGQVDRIKEPDSSLESREESRAEALTGDPDPGYRKLIVFPLIGGGFVWAILASLPKQRLALLHSAFRVHPIYWLAVGLVCLMLVHLVRRDRPALSRLVDKLFPRARRVLLVYAAVALCAYLLAIGVGAWQEGLAVLAAMATIVELRSPAITDFRLRLSGDLVRMMVAMFLASLIALLPVVTLPIGMDGQQSRFSYLSTFFAVPAMSAAILGLWTDRGRSVLAALGILSCALLAVNTNDYGHAGEISKVTARAVRGLLPCRRIYVLAAPGTLNGANLFVGGMDRIGSVVAQDRTVKIATGVTVLNVEEGDRIRLRRLDSLTYLFEFVKHPGPRLHNPSLIFAPDRQMFSIGLSRGAALIHLNGLQAGDHVMFVDSQGPHLEY